ncbi:formiminotransferase N-terminal subdomain-containing protein isoform X1 [Protopterus annectens]|uniref:formiminotransferase N-terminal subdomain-containing protein isoform X1 n=1 Tax=Protopterus annectens TaxID=7888 RepID=UPI001CFC0223|nr:formiminotransferase N-terminal subdomain-containing protein isoform X1 [Protopterus annectens]
MNMQTWKLVYLAARKAGTAGSINSDISWRLQCMTYFACGTIQLRKIKMAALTAKFRLAACLLNISEGRRKNIVEKVAKAAVCNEHGQKHPETTVLNLFCDFDYNRSVLTIAAPVEKIGRSVVSACVEAYNLIDMNEHHGIHPCLGAVDLVPIYPLSESVSLDECGAVAQSIAEELTHQVPGCSIFYFGHADQPLNRSLVERRKELGWFNSCFNLNATRPDVGTELSLRYGLTGVGASPYVMNCNVTLDSQDLNAGRKIASSIRGVNQGGIQGVQAMAFPHVGKVEIACNVESVKEEKPTTSVMESKNFVSYRIGGQCYVYATPQTIEARVQTLAEHYGFGTVGIALVGFTPQKCKSLAEIALSQGAAEFWKKQERVYM